MTDVLRFNSFSTEQTGGNPAGVVLDASGLDDVTMQGIAARLGYPETGFLWPEGERVFRVRYFSPSAEVGFCGHVTIASGVALAGRLGVGRFALRTNVGEVPVDVAKDSGGALRACFTSVEPALREISDGDVSAVLASLGWISSDLDPALPPRLAYAGGWQPVVAAASRARLGELAYDTEALRDLSVKGGWNGAMLVWRESATLFHVRVLAPALGVDEDPATGSAAAAFGHYLRELGLVAVPARVTLRQGDDIGRPATITVDIAADRPGIVVGGNAIGLGQVEIRS